MIVGTPPSINMWHTSPDDAWHTFSSGWNPSGFSYKIHGARFSYSDCLKEGQTTLISINIWPTFTIHPDDQHRSSGYDCPGHWLKESKSYTLSQTACHGPRSATCRVKRQDEVTTSHFPRSFHIITYHDLWQPHHLPRSLSTAHRVMMVLTPPSVIMITQNISPPLKRGTKLLMLYIQTFTQGGR